MPAIFTPNPACPSEIEHSDFMAAWLLTQASEIADEAKAIAPVLTGAYQASITGKVEDAKAIVSASAPYSSYLEFGTSDTPTFQTLRRALDAHSF